MKPSEILERDILKISGLLNVEQPLAVIPVDIFDDRFIPVFFNEENDENKKQSRLATWIYNAGGDDKPVRVLDKDGTQLFIVPPIMDKSKINSKLDGTIKPMGDSVKEVELAKGSYGPGRMNKLVNDEFSPRIKKLIGEGEYSWDPVIDHYNQLRGVGKMDDKNPETESLYGTFE